MLIGVRSLKTCIAQSQISGYLCDQSVFFLALVSQDFHMYPHCSLCTLDYYLVLRDVIAFTIRKPPRMRGSACVMVMTTLHGSTPFLWRCARVCIPSVRSFFLYQGSFKVHTFFFSFQSDLDLDGVALDHSIRIPFLYVGAFESFQGLFNHNLDPILLFLVSS